MGLDFEHCIAGTAYLSLAGHLEVGLGSPPDLFIHLAGSCCWQGLNTSRLEQQKPLRHLSIYLCCFPTWSIQHCNFKVDGLFTRWLRVPKVHIERERERMEESRKLVFFTWSGLRSPFCPITLVRTIMSPRRLKKRGNRCHLLMRSGRSWMVLEKHVELKILSGHFWKIQSATMPHIHLCDTIYLLI